jgi:phosphoglycolate phosphatase
VKHPLILFDFDGTLADSFPWFLRNSNQVAEKHRFKRIDSGNLEVLRRLGYGLVS